MRITAALAEAANTPFTLEEVELGEPGPDEIVLQVHGAGLCHTDIAARDGVYGLRYPLVLGHEGAGVVAIGSDVRNLRVGDRVALSFGSCGECRLCRAGQPSYCVDFTAQNYIGSRPDGSATLHRGGEGKQEVVHGNFFSQSSLASSAIANARNAVKVDTDLDLAIAGTLGCGFQTVVAGAGLHGLNAADLDAGRRGGHHQHRQAVVLGTGVVLPGQQEHVLGDVRRGDPGLLTVDDVLTAVAARAGAQAAEVGARAGLRQRDGLQAPAARLEAIVFFCSSLAQHR